MRSTIHASISQAALGKLNDLAERKKLSLSAAVDYIILSHGTFYLTNHTDLDLLDLKLDVQEELDKRKVKH